ncbi:MAG: hypothetical protein PWP23_2072 [Candidatus Sumerlaeota bacterium]|nr:hypothetical protein [Candidatus Sumerlaeota bacterium]
MTLRFPHLVLLAAIFLGVSACASHGVRHDEASGAEYSGAAGRSTASFFAMNGIIPFHHYVSDDAQVRAKAWETMEESLAVAQAAGSTGFRLDMWWSVIEPEPGRFNWEVPDHAIAAMKAAGQEPLPILCYTSAWAEDGAAPATPEARAQFAAYCRAFAERYGEDVTYYEVWNEPDVDVFWRPEPNPRDYVLLLQEAYAAIKQADPDSVVAAMCTAWADLDFMEQVYEAGAQGHFDAVSFHQYDARAKDSVLEEHVRGVRRLMTRYGDGAKPILLTEIGLSTGPCPILPAVSEEYQARWVVKKHLIALASGIDRYYHFKLKDDHDSTNPDGYWGLYKWDGTPKLLASAYAAMTARVGDATFLGRAPRLEANPARLGDAEFQLYRTRAGELLAVGWVRDDGAPLAVRIPASSSVTMESMSGEMLRTIEPVDGRVELPLDAEPRYFRGLSAEAALLTAIQFRPAELLLAPGTTRTVAIDVVNPTDKTLKVKLADLLDPPDTLGLTLKASDETLDVPAGKTARAALDVTLAPTASMYRRAAFRRSIDGRLTMAFDVFPIEPLAFEMSAAPLGGIPGVTATAQFRNFSGAPVSGEVRWRLNGVEQPGVVSVPNLPVRESATASTPVISLEGEVSAICEVRLDSGALARGILRVAGQSLTANPPAMDGGQADWNDPSTLRLLPFRQQTVPPRNERAIDSNAFRATAMAKWSATHFYIGVDVVDSTPMVNPHTDADLWRGDSVEVYLGFPGPTEETTYPEGFYQLVLSPGDGGRNPAAWNHRPRNPSDKDAGRIAGLEIASKATENGYYIEAAIPLSEFGVAGMQAGQVIAFDLHVNNKKTPGAETYEEVLVWNGDGGEWKDPSDWGVAVILPDPELVKSPGRQQYSGVDAEFPVSPVATKDPAFKTPVAALPEDREPFAAPLPEGVVLALPFDGPHEMSSGYGYESPSWTHQTIGNKASANDFFAIDISMPVGTPIYATAAGRLIQSGRRSDSYGNYMVIDHGNGLQSIYAHLDRLEFEVDRGEPVVDVEQGQLLGYSGNSGTRWPHLHFALHLNARSSHSGANIGGLAVVPEPLGGYYGLRKGHVLER